MQASDTEVFFVFAHKKSFVETATLYQFRIRCVSSHFVLFSQADKSRKKRISEL